MRMPEGLAAAAAAAAGSDAVRAALALIIPAVTPRVRVSTKMAEYYAPLPDPGRFPIGSPQRRKLRTKRPMSEDRKTIVVNRRFPYKGGTKAARTFAMMTECTTVGEFRRRCHESPEQYDIGYLNYAARDGHITITD